MMSTRNEELVEEQEKKARSCNLIIHGRPDTSEEDDKLFFGSLIKQIAVGKIEPKTIKRIGTPNSNKKRPILIQLHKEEHKCVIMDSLKRLKDLSEFKGIRITEDYTISERAMIKEYQEEAKNRNNADPNADIAWKVRGTPKNGLIFK